MSEALTDGAGREITVEQFQTWVVAQAVRNALEGFHGGGAFDPDDPDSGEGFISDAQMRALNIVIRRTVHEAQGKLRDLGGDEGAEDAGGYCWFQLSGVAGYMEPPGSPELEEAYRKVTREPSD
jgi:hypothetical protein